MNSIPNYFVKQKNRRTEMSIAHDLGDGELRYHIVFKALFPSTSHVYPHCQIKRLGLGIKTTEIYLPSEALEAFVALYFKIREQERGRP